MLFYDWQKILRYSNGKVQTIRTIYESILGVKRAAVGRKKYENIDFSGDSFLLKPDNLLSAFWYGNQVDAANYLMLASRRNLANYLVTGDPTLPTKYINIPIDRLKRNSLIDIEQNKIHFLLEK